MTSLAVVRGVQTAAPCEIAAEHSASAQAAAVFRAARENWCGASWAGGAVLSLTFNHPTRRAAAASLAGSREPLSAEELTPVQQHMIDLVRAYFAGERVDFLGVQVEESHLTAFGRRVVAVCRAIPYGETLCYAQVAQLAGSPGAARAVGNVMAANRAPIIVPCHRVVGAGGSLGGYSAPGGLEVKRHLLALEQRRS